MQTGAPGYNEYWSKKQEKVKARYEAMKEFLGAKEAANGALQLESSAAVQPDPSYHPLQITQLSSGEDQVFALPQGADFVNASA